MYCLCLSLHYLVFELFKCVLKLILRRCILFCLIPSWQERQVESCMALCPITSRLDNLWNLAYVRTSMLIGISVLSIINNHTISMSLHAWWLTARHVDWLWPWILALLICFLYVYVLVEFFFSLAHHEHTGKIHYPHNVLYLLGNKYCRRSVGFVNFEVMPADSSSCSG